MSAHCCAAPTPNRVDPAYRRVLWIALLVNAVMFVMEVTAGLAAGSVSLQADALDFLGDSANYAISLFVLGMALRYRASAALGKGLTMAVFGMWVIAMTTWQIANGTVPHAVTMGAVGIAAALSNALVLALLWSYRTGDSNMRSVWICSRNDVLGNIAVIGAAVGVFGTGSGWPDVAVAVIMAALALQGAWTVIWQALADIQQADASTATEMQSR